MKNKNLDYDFHLAESKRLFGFDSPETQCLAERHAQRQHSLLIFDELQNLATSTPTFAGSLQSKDAVYYMLYGAGRRLLMMWSSYSEITLTAPADRTSPLSETEQTALNRDLNVLYMHLRGVLDNWAWSILYEKEDELTRQLRKTSICLFSPEIRQRSKFRDFWGRLDVYKDWNRDVKERRDPVAHRIPLYIPNASLTPPECAHYEAVRREYLAAVAKLELGNSEALFAELNRIGTFHPHFLHHPEQEIIPIYPTLPSDMAQLIRIGRLVEAFLIKGGEAQNSHS